MWLFRLAGEPGEHATPQRFRVTDKPIDTCFSGDWFELEGFEEKLDFRGMPLRAAYQVDRRHLMLDFAARPERRLHRPRQPGNSRLR